MPGSLLAGGLRGRGRGRRRGVRPALDFEEALVERERSRDDLLLTREAHAVRVAARREVLEPHGFDLRECDLGKRIELVTQAARVRHGLLGDRTARHENVEEDLADLALHLAARRDDREHRRARLGRVLAVLVAHVERHRRERGRKFGGRPPQAPDPEATKPEPQAQRNFTDPESRIMKDGATKELVQAYNAQAAVDSHAQVIVVAAVTKEANDKKQLVPMLKEVKVQMGIPPQRATADNGYFSEPNVTDAQLQEIDLFVAPDGQKHSEKPPT